MISTQSCHTVVICKVTIGYHKMHLSPVLFLVHIGFHRIMPLCS
uniref:Uncharacterized protein n=1 Tax=Arundo donax TaxID=35708 RepID=A0A0A8Y2X3_ARUDO